MVKSITKHPKLLFIVTLLLCAVGFTLNFCTYYPGFMSPDTVDQYGQSITGHFVSWHPPVMAFTWRLLNHIYQGPQLMLVLQLFFLWYSYYVFATTLHNFIGRIILFLIFFFAPFIQNFTGYVIKDSMMALSWLLAIALLFKYIRTGGRHRVFTIIFSGLLLLYGTWMRHNAATGLLPLCFAWVWILFGDKTRRIKIAAAIGLFIFIIAGEALFVSIVLKPLKGYPDTAVYMYDLTAEFMDTHHDVYPASFYKYNGFDTNYIKAHYDPACIDNLLWNTDNVKIRPTHRADIKALRRAWVYNILTSPEDYFNIRYNEWLYYLHIKQGNELQYFFPWIHPNPYGLKINESSILYKNYVDFMWAQKKMFYFKPLFWILLNVFLFAGIPILRNKMTRILYSGLVTSSLLYMLPLFFMIATDKDFRYIYWVCIACATALIILLISLFKPKEA